MYQLQIDQRLITMSVSKHNLNRLNRNKYTKRLDIICTAEKENFQATFERLLLSKVLRFVGHRFPAKGVAWKNNLPLSLRRA